MKVTSDAPFEPEDRRKHLEFIQLTIARMSAASTTTKSWMLPVATATYGYALTQRSQSVALLGIAAVALFAYLDAHYLRQEKRFRRLYEAVAGGANGIAPFSLDPDDLALEGDRPPEEWPKQMPSWINQVIPGPLVWRSWSLYPFYLGLVAVGVAIAFRVGSAG